MMGVLTAAIVYRMQRLVEMSGNDSLTGLPNRAWLLQGMPRMFETIRNDGGSLTLELLDLDRFKRIHAEIGHRRSEERRVGEEGVSTGRTRWARGHYKKN